VYGQEPVLPVVPEGWVHIIQEAEGPPENFFHIVYVGLIDFDCFKLLLEKLKGKETKEDALDESRDTHDESYDVTLLREQRDQCIIILRSYFFLSVHFRLGDHKIIET